MGRLYDIIQTHIDAQQHGASIRKVALAIGVSPTTVSNWRNITELPSRENLEAIARVTGVTYAAVFRAASIDAGYITETTLDQVVEERHSKNYENDRRALDRIDRVRERLSEPAGTTDDLIAAHEEDVSISAEQEGEQQP